MIASVHRHRPRHRPRPRPRHCHRHRHRRHCRRRCRRSIVVATSVAVIVVATWWFSGGYDDGSRCDDHVTYDAGLFHDVYHDDERRDDYKDRILLNSKWRTAL